MGSRTFSLQIAGIHFFRAPNSCETPASIIVCSCNYNNYYCAPYATEVARGAGYMGYMGYMGYNVNISLNINCLNIISIIINYQDSDIEYFCFNT